MPEQSPCIRDIRRISPPLDQAAAWKDYANDQEKQHKRLRAELLRLRAEAMPAWVHEIKARRSKDQYPWQFQALCIEQTQNETSFGRLQGNLKLIFDACGIDIDAKCLGRYQPIVPPLVRRG